MYDNDTQLLVNIFQEVFQPREKPDNDVERNPVKYVQRHKRQIEFAGRLFEYLGLAEPDTQSPLGWRPTHRLLKIIAKRATRQSKLIDRMVNAEEELITSLLFDAVIRDRAELGQGALVSCVLHALGLFRNTTNGDSLPSVELRELFAAGYYAHLEPLANRERKGKLALQALTEDAARQSAR